MTDKKISELSAATAPTGAETVEVVQGGTNKKATIDQVRGLKFARVPVSSAEILALFASPKLLVAAPGTGKMIFPDDCIGLFADGGTPYAVTEQVQVQFSNAAGGISVLTINSLDGGVDGVSSKGGLETGNFTDKFENLGLYLFAAASPTDGNGTLLIDIMYRIVDLP